MKSVPTSKDHLIHEIAEVIAKAVNLADLNTAELTPQTRLSDAPLSLDSIDILESVLAIETHFGVTIKSAEEGRKYFESLGTVADFIMLNRSKTQ